MTWVEITVIIVSSLIVLSVVGSYIYRRIKHMPTGDCAYCKKDSKKLLKEYRKKYKSK
jgi:hypothetical protein